ncbi:DUF6504 family protein [Propioniciclava sinopodophylli]|uniref:DUF6504 family protein n=1 Tax=Propioniciclava sinopodophylli TaxID=1837344 RepID=UPI00248FA8CF|nr:DUF6504 family protein [Propioniciclava sinopodophylli]
MRRYDEPIAVRSGEVAGEPAPVEFVWRRRLWRVLGVETRWRETGQWWVPGGGSRGSAEGSGDDLLAEAEVYRVLASAGRSSLPGVYELAHPLSGDAWFLRAVVD